jgi:hypothetical protein
VRLHPELGQARAALRAGQPAIAAALARQALDRDPADLQAGLLLGLSLEAEGRGQEAVAALAGVAHTAPGPSTGEAQSDALTALARLLPAALPDRMPPELLSALPGAGPERTVGSVSFRVVAPEGTLASPVIDPKYGWKFARRLAVYVGAARRYSVYYQDAADTDLARRVAELLGCLHGAAERWSPPARPEVRVWLAHAGRAGGEQYGDSIYLFAIDVTRGDSEWVREVAHELGHVVLPSFARFEAPEPMENGYLGERLLPQWLLELGEQTVWDGRVSLADYIRERVIPLRSRYLNAGPASPLRADRGPAGMEYAIGLVLALEAQHGPAFLTRVMRRNSGAGLESLLLAYRDEVAAAGRYSIPAELVVPRSSQTEGIARGRLRFRRAVYRAYLPSGRWVVMARGERLEGVQMWADGHRLSPAAGSDSERQFALTTGVSRWHLLQLKAIAPGAALAEVELAPAAQAVTRALSPRPAGRKNPPPRGNSWRRNGEQRRSGSEGGAQP